MSGARVVWVTVASPLVVAALAFGTANAVTAIAHEQEFLSSSFPAAGITAVELHGQGEVRITGADVDEIRVDMRVSHGLRRTRHREQVRDGVLVLDVGCPDVLSAYCEVDHTLVIPRHLDVWAHNDSGPIEIQDVDGDLDVDNDAGRIVLTGIGADVAVVGNDAGRIEVEFVEPPSSVDVHNDAGSIDIVLPAVDEGYAVDADNGAGSIDILVRNDPTSPRTVRVENDAGAITVRHP